MVNKILAKNLSSLHSHSLKEALTQVKNTRYKIIVNGGGGLENSNILDVHTNELVFKDSATFYKEKLKFYEKYELYKVLYFYGFANAYLYILLLKNPNLKHVVIFDDDLELLSCVLSEYDYSRYFKENKLILLSKNDENIMRSLFVSKGIFDSLRVYFLDICSDFYLRYESEILALQNKISSLIKETVISKGNSAADTLVGMRNTVDNIQDMVSNSSLKELISLRRKASKTAIIVSTGPSLHKQLPLLKAYEQRASIFCADSAYSILAKHDIKPDYVLMCERTDVTAKLFEQNFPQIDKDIIFVLTSVVSPLAVKYLKESARKFIIVSYEAAFIKSLKLQDFGYLNIGSSVAHNALELAYQLEHQNIIFIGQDLAYDSKGASHSKDYIYTEFYESNDLQGEEELVAYGGVGTVKSHKIWKFFKGVLEKMCLNIQNNKNKQVRLINATQGGARINYTQELSFKDCETLLDEVLKKPFKDLEPRKNAPKLLEKIYKEMQKLNLICKQGIKNLENTMLKAIELFNGDKDDLLKSREILSFLLAFIDEFSEFLDKNPALLNVLTSDLSNFRLSFTKIFVCKTYSNSEEVQKNLQLINLITEAMKSFIIDLKLLDSLLEKSLEKS